MAGLDISRMGVAIDVIWSYWYETPPEAKQATADQSRRAAQLYMGELLLREVSNSFFDGVWRCTCRKKKEVVPKLGLEGTQGHV